MAYDPQNVFARIIRGEIPAKKLLENEHVIAFSDIAPKARVHVLVIPKGPYLTADEFALNASESELAAFTRAIGTIVKELGLEATGYRLISNNGEDGGQIVPHYHVHIIGGEKLPAMV